MIDLHTHTLFSDGTSTLEELLQEAENKKIEILSITDHDTVKEHLELRKINNPFTGQIIPGIEITTTYNGEIIEVLGYNFNIDKMNQLLEQYVPTRYQRFQNEFELIKKQYKSIGVIFNEENITFDPNTESCRVAFVNEIKKYPENNKYFLYEESIKTLAGFSRNEVFNPKSKLYVDESSIFPSLEKVIDIIHECNGITFLAHPFAYSKNIHPEIENIINNYKLDGLECFYTTFTKEQSNYLVNLCKKHNLLMSGGSDFHGTAKINHFLGVGNNNLNISKDILNNWPKKEA